MNDRLCHRFAMLSDVENTSWKLEASVQAIWKGDTLTSNF